MDDVTAALPAAEPDSAFDAMFSAALEHSRAVDEAHNVDHLLRSQP